MTLAILGPARVVLQTWMRSAGDRAKVEISKLVLLTVAAGLLLSAGLVALAGAVGYPIAALVFAAFFFVLAFAVHMVGRTISARQAQRMAQARHRTEADVAMAVSVARSTLPLLPVVALVAAFTLARRK
jgi:UPF0716 family protein affecting phage T7 exclusion